MLHSCFQDVLPACPSAQPPADETSKNGVQQSTDSIKGDLELGGAPSKPKKASLPFTPVTLAFQDVQYSVPLPKVREHGSES